MISAKSEILKAHRTSYLYNEYGMYNVPLSLPKLEEAFKDQLLVRWDRELLEIAAPVDVDAAVKTCLMPRLWSYWFMTCMLRLC